MAGAAIFNQLKFRGYNNIVVSSHKELDLENQEAVFSFFQHEQPEYVFFAAGLVGGVGYKQSHPLDMLNKNLHMIMNVLDASYYYHVKKILNIGSVLLYPERENGISENEIGKINLDGTDAPYTLAKLTGEKLCEYYKEQYGLQTVTLVPCNFFGENSPFGTDKAGVIPALIERFHMAKARKMEEVVVWGTGKACREFLYVQDLADACLFVMQLSGGGSVLNVGTGNEISIYDAAMVIKDVVGYTGHVVFDTSKPEGRKHMVLDSKRLYDLGWKNITSFEKAIYNTYQWYMENMT